MSIWRLPDAQFGDSLGKNEIPEIAVVHKDLFRAFTLGDGAKYPIAFRSDTRTLDEVDGHKGFNPRQTVAAKYSAVKAKVKTVDKTLDRLRDVKADLLKSLKGTEEENAAAVARKLDEMVAIRIGNVDLDVDTAVCVTLDYKIAGLFPYDPQDASLLKKPARVYVMRMRGWMETFSVQAYLAKHLAYSKEVACLGVPLRDILGCVIVSRSLEESTVTLEIEKTELRPGADKAEFEAVIKALPAKTTVRTPSPKDDSALMDVATKYGHIKDALEGLTGKPNTKDIVPKDLNVIKGEAALTLPAYEPKKKLPPKPSTTSLYT